MEEKQLKAELLAELHDNILPFWQTHMTDPEGGFFGRMTGRGELRPDAERSAILCGRILWTFAAAYRTTGREEYLRTAAQARDYLLEHFIDRRYGGVFWSVDAQGRPLDTKKQFYALAFAIYGLSEYARATGDAQATEEAAALYCAIETRSYDPAGNGYEEAATHDWQP